MTNEFEHPEPLPIYGEITASPGLYLCLFHGRNEPRQKMDGDCDGFSKSTIAAFDGHRIAMPERFGPHPEFLEAHAKQFRYL